MTQKYHLLFVHGWGFSKDFWKPLENLLSDFTVHFIDLGFVGQQQSSDTELNTILSRQHSYVAIGHSLGFLYLLKQFPLSFYHYVAINSFLRFSKTDDFVSGISERILQRMSKGIDENDHSVLSQFYQQCQYYPEQPIFPHVKRLQIGLKWLQKEDYRFILPQISSKLTVIASDHDPVVSKNMTYNSFNNHQIIWAKDKTHILPITQPALCATSIKNIALSR